MRQRRDDELQQLAEQRRCGSAPPSGALWPRLILVEGFLLFSSPSPHALHSLFSLSLFMHASYTACYDRRFQRSKIVGSSAYNQQSYDSFFRELVWAAYLKYNAHVLALASLDVQQASRDVHSPLPLNLAAEEQQLPPFTPPAAPINALHMLSSEEDPQITFAVAVKLIADVHPALAEHAKRCEAIAASAAALDQSAAASSDGTVASAAAAPNCCPLSPTAHCRFLTRAERLVVLQRVQCALLSQHLLASGTSDAEVQRVLQRTPEVPKEAAAAAAAVAVDYPSSAPPSQAERSFDLFRSQPNSEAATTTVAASASPSPAAPAAGASALATPAPIVPSPLLLAPVTASAPLSPSHVLAYDNVPLADLSDMRLLSLLCINARRKK